MELLRLMNQVIVLSEFFHFFGERPKKGQREKCESIFGKTIKQRVKGQAFGSQEFHASGFEISNKYRSKISRRGSKSPVTVKTALSAGGPFYYI